MSRLRKLVAAKKDVPSAELTPEAQQLVDSYSDCKNAHGKISPYTIIIKRDLGEVQTMQSPKQMADFVGQKMSEYNTMFKSKKIKSDIYNCPSDNAIGTLKANMAKSKNVDKALNCLFNAELKGSGEGVLNVGGLAPTKSNDIDFASILNDKDTLAYVSGLLSYISKKKKK